jgi:hypothetical protein
MGWQVVTAHGLLTDRDAAATHAHSYTIPLRERFAEE